MSSRSEITSAIRSPLRPCRTPTPRRHKLCSPVWRKLGKILCIVLLWSTALVIALPANIARLEPQADEPAQPVLFFAHVGPVPECSRLSVFGDSASSNARYTISNAIAVGEVDHNAHPSRLAATRGVTSVFSIRAHSVGSNGPDDMPPYVHLTMLESVDGAWNTRELFLDQPSTSNGGIAMTPDNRDLLVATQENEVFCEPQRFFVGRYPMRGLPEDKAPAWRAEDRFISDSPIGEIQVDGPLAHLVTAPLWEEDPDLPQEVITIDTRTMTEVAKRVEIEATWTKKHSSCNWVLPNLRATLSNDGRYLFTNRNAPSLNVVDLVRREADTITIPSEVAAGSGDLAFNRFRTDRQLLAVHMITKIVLYEWLAEVGLVQKDAVPIEYPGYTVSVRAPISWTRGGDVLAAVSTDTDVDYLRWRVSTGLSFSRSTSEYDLCAARPVVNPEGGRSIDAQIDVISANDVAPLQHPLGYASPTAPVPTLTSEPHSPSPAPTATSEPSATATAVATFEPTPTRIAVQVELYVPYTTR